MTHTSVPSNLFDRITRLWQYHWAGLTFASLLAFHSGTAKADEHKLPVASVIASSDDGNVPKNTVDGSLSTRWSAFGVGQWIQYDLGATRDITLLEIAWYKGNERKTQCEIFFSSDAVTWTKIYGGFSSGQTTQPESYIESTVLARYVRIVCYGNTLTLWNSITETRFFGFDPPPVASDPTPGIPQPAPTGTYPADILDILNWKLTLPVNTAHAGSPDEILQPELDTFQDDYFFADIPHSGVVFRAPCGGATTSGSGYPRSELREMTKNGTALASWATTSGTHTLEIVQAITHLPVVKPHVVAGQIHDANDDVMVVRLEGSKLFIDLNGKAGPTLTSTYKLGDIFAFKFVAHDGGVDCYYNGKYIYRYGVSRTGCYFKVGCYTQSNLTKGDLPTAYGEVAVYSTKVTHQ